MKKFLQTTLVAVLGFVMAFSAVACGNKTDSGSSEQTSASESTSKPSESTSESKPSGETGLSATIEMYTTVNIIEQRALERVAEAYMNYQYEKGNDISVIIKNNTDPTAYSQSVKTMAGGTVSSPTIVCTGVIPEYYGTNKLYDFTEALETANPYMGGKTWKEGLEADAYRTQVSGSSMTVPGLSYSSNYLTVFYNKQAVADVLEGYEGVAADGTIDNSKITWSWMLGALEKAKTAAGKNFKTPLALSTSTQSTGEVAFNMLSHLVNMYLDQYYRDFINEVHSASGDYSFLEGDDKWVYDANDAGIDSADRYSYNLNKVVDLYFNKEGYNPTSAKYKEVMENLYDLMSYADNQASYGDMFNRFNETTIVYSKGGGAYNDMKLFYVEALDYVRTYRDAHKKGSVYPSSAEIGSEIGWFLMPAMKSSLPGVADNVRAYGGPQENYGILNSTATNNKFAVDFMMYLYSPEGQSSIYAYYKSQNKAPVTMRQLVKNVTVPSEIDFTGLISASGDCTTSPYLIFGKCSGMNQARVGDTTEYVYDKVGGILSNYFRGTEKTWNGTAMFDAIKSGFASYASNANLKYTDYSKVAEATGSALNGNPFNTSGN